MRAVCPLPLNAPFPTGPRCIDGGGDLRGGAVAVVVAGPPSGVAARRTRLTLLVPAHHSELPMELTGAKGC